MPEEQQSISSQAPSVQDVDKICAMTDPVLRNLEITQCYYLLSNAFASRARSGANWCTFAAWASKQAGQTIRMEDLHRTPAAFLKQQPGVEEAVSLLALAVKKSGADRDTETLHHAIFQALVEPAALRASDAVSRGNKKVFEEIAREFSRFIGVCFGDEAFDNSHISAFCQQLKPGPPPAGQDYLREAFENYYKVFFETGEKQAAEGTLLANLLIGFHEQTRLQPEIAESLNAAVDRKWIRQKLQAEIFPKLGWWQRFVQFFKSVFTKTNLLDQAIEVLASKAELHLRRAMTAHLMTLAFPPGRVLHLGSDLTANFPPNLQQLTNAALLALLEKIDPTPDSLAQSGATDWANLPERMHYIADMFRCFHQSQNLFDEVFTKTQLEQLAAGKIPGGAL